MDENNGTMFGNLDSAAQVDYLSKNVIDPEPEEQNPAPEEPEEDAPETQPQTEPEAPQPEEEEEPEEETEEEETQPESEEPDAPPLYKPEEYLAIEDPGLVDSRRLPPDARIVHERDLKFFNDHVRPALEQMNSELVALRNYRAQVEAERAASAQAASAGVEDVNFDAITPDQIAAYSSMEAARQLGVAQIDTSNPQHMAALSYVTTEVTNRIAQAKADAAAQKKQKAENEARQKQINYQLGTLKQQLMQDPHFAEIDQFALKSINTLPYHVHQAIMQDFHSGDPQRVAGVYKFFAQRWAQDQAARKKVEQTAKAATVKAPKLQGGSMAKQPDSREFSLNSWSSGKAKDQTKMLLDSGLV